MEACGDSLVRMMRNIVWLLAVCLLAAPHRRALGASHVKDWIPLTTAWQKEEGSSDESAGARLVHLCKPGEFAFMEFRLLKEVGGLMIDPSGALLVHRGTWARKAGKMQVTYRMTLSDLVVLPVGEKPDTSEKEGELRIEGKRLVLRGEVYEPCAYRAEDGWGPQCK